MTAGPDLVERGEVALGEGVIVVGDWQPEVNPMKAVIKLGYAVVVATMSAPTAGEDPIDAR
ncbi:hypothetical protein [Actinopolyspora alba]|uniref:hypothetical protein n=1 Tax=Actinopolyspora alba TaxID=673379 RepID=UPI000B85FCCD|nr:hypothetical protein [Actinopolyspora alba]